MQLYTGGPPDCQEDKWSPSPQKFSIAHTSETVNNLKTYTMQASSINEEPINIKFENMPTLSTSSTHGG